jgi:hypothetical protein
VKTDPSGSCNNSTALQWNATSGNLSGCKASTWGTIATAGTSGSVTVNGVTCTLESSCTVTANPTNAAAVVAAFTSCSGTQYLGADGSCHTASGGGGSTFAQGTFANLPSCTTSLNELYLPTDSIYNSVGCPSGASSWSYFKDGRSVTPPILSNFTSVNPCPSGCSVTTVQGGIYVNTGTSGGGGPTYSVAYPSTPFTLAVGVVINFPDNGYTYSFFSLNAISATACQQFLFASNLGAEQLQVLNRVNTSCGAGSSALILQYGASEGGNLWLYLTDDGTTQTWYVGKDGATKTKIYSSTTGYRSSLQWSGGGGQTYGSSLWLFNWSICSSASGYC